MRNFMKPAFAGAVCSLLATGAFAFSSPEEKAQELLSRYEKTGENVNCLRLNSIRDTDALDDYTLLVEVSGGDIYINELNGRCSGLGREQRYARSSTEARMCKGDIIRVLDSFGNMRGSCSLGAFEKLSELSEQETQSE
ncbi:MAG: hypothetical protein CMI63_00050 [Parvularcula sp.]|nr:hypothetical protein [Parvularcula sp.]